MRSVSAPVAERLVGALAAIAALALLSGCGAGDSPDAEPAAAQERAASSGGQPEDGEVVDISGTAPVGEMTAGSVAPLAECRDWLGADPAERLATIDDIRSQINLEDSGIEMPALTDEEAGELFDDACRPAYAGGFRLYKLYARAAGFVELNRMLEEGG